MTVAIDTDGDGEPEATLPLKWVLAVIATLVASSPFAPWFL